MDTWENPNDNVLRFKLTTAKFADAFLQRGNIKFNTPKNWEEYEVKHGDGRGDFYEGTLAFCHFMDLEKLTELNHIYSNSNPLNPHGRQLIKKIYNQRILYKDARSMYLPCFCLYILKVDAFTMPKCAGKQKLKTHIPGSYFKDFVDHKSSYDIDHLPSEEQPAVIVITDFSTFTNRLKNTLIRLGIPEKDILTGYVSYLDFEKYGPTGWYDFGQEYPNELFIKSSRFDNQSEGRIIINTCNASILERLKQPIDLGDMSDIAIVKKGYFPDGIDIELTTIIKQSK